MPFTHPAYPISPERLIVERVPAHGLRRVLLVVLALLIVEAGAWLGGPDAADARARGRHVARPKAVIIAGPVGGRTHDFLASARHIANQARAAGMDVHRVFHPNATWKRVIKQIQGASFVAYVGHGNGWPSPYGPFQEDTKNGFGLDPYKGAAPGEVEYHGADEIRAQVELAPHAVVVLYRLCYAAGNGEAWMAPVRRRTLASRRVDNFASGFLRAGASTVFAFGTSQRVNIPRLLMRSSKSMDAIFRVRGSRSPGAYDGFKGSSDYYRRSSRSHRARLHLDPHPRYGHMRAVTGSLRLSARKWRLAAIRSRQRPRISGVRVIANPLVPQGHGVPSFSPNGDGVNDRLRIERRITEPSKVKVTIRNGHGRIVRRIRQHAGAGLGTTAWDGRDGKSRRVPDGRYRVSLVARDSSGKRSRSKAIHVRVLTSLRAYRTSRDAIHIHDRDELARSVRLRVMLAERARVVWTIRDGHGDVVRTLLKPRQVRQGRLVRLWDGRDDRGGRVPDGAYTATLVATTRHGSVHSQQPILVGQYQMDVSETPARRGKRLRVRIHATERLRRAPHVMVRQPGLEPYEIKTARRSTDAYRVVFTPRSKGRPGTMWLTIIGTDTGGQLERQNRRLRLR